MKMLRIGQSSKAGVRRFAPVISALTVAVCLGAGAAMAQTVSVSTAGTADEYTPGQVLTVEFEFTGTGITGDVTALGWELSGLPAGSTVVTDTPANNCAPAITANPGPPTANAVQVKTPEPAILNEGQPNEACNPITTDGSTPFEFFFLVQQPAEGEATPLPVQLPVTVQVEILIPGEATGDLTLSTVNRYRIDAGAEQNNEGAPVTDVVTEGVDGCLTVQGDANGNGNVTAGDAQVVFEQAIGLGTVESPLCAECNGSAAGSNPTAGDAQAIFEVAIGVRTMCTGPTK